MIASDILNKLEIGGTLELAFHMNDIYYICN